MLCIYHSDRLATKLQRTSFLTENSGKSDTRQIEDSTDPGLDMKMLKQQKHMCGTLVNIPIQQLFMFSMCQLNYIHQPFSTALLLMKFGFACQPVASQFHHQKEHKR